MKLILTREVAGLGSAGDVVTVKDGFARNFLLPQGKALEITSGSTRQINHLKAKRAEREAREVTAAEEIASKINKLSPVFILEAGVSGKAFGSVTAKDIHDRLVQDLKLDDLPKHAVVLEKAIKEGGAHTVSVKVHGDVTATLKVQVNVNVPARAEAADLGDDSGERKTRRKVTNRE